MEGIAATLVQHGLALVFANVLITQLGAPLPAIPTMIVAGALAQQGHWSAALVVGVAVVASLMGDLPWFYAGRRYGYRVLNTLCRIAVEPDTCVRQTENIFHRWGPPSLMIAKFVPGFATVAPPIAGAFKLGLVAFIAYSAVGAALWSGASVIVGMLFHAQIDSALQWVGQMGGWSALVLGVIVVVYIATKWLERWLFIRVMRMARITVDELHERMRDQLAPVVLDARSAAARALDPRRIPGALMIDTTAPVLHSDVRPDRDVVIYCT
ncbi:MAG TPA: VTT domain-containing protein [Burkholderiales bacterium]|nr:VTT domain-containing protein [Burkholderiales bacterium]